MLDLGASHDQSDVGGLSGQLNMAVWGQARVTTPGINAGRRDAKWLIGAIAGKCHDHQTATRRQYT